MSLWCLEFFLGVLLSLLLNRGQLISLIPFFFFQQFSSCRHQALALSCVLFVVNPFFRLLFFQALDCTSNFRSLSLPMKTIVRRRILCTSHLHPGQMTVVRPMSNYLQLLLSRAVSVAATGLTSQKTTVRDRKIFSTRLVVAELPAGWVRPPALSPMPSCTTASLCDVLFLFAWTFLVMLAVLPLFPLVSSSCLLFRLQLPRVRLVCCHQCQVFLLFHLVLLLLGLAPLAVLVGYADLVHRPVCLFIHLEKTFALLRLAGQATIRHRTRCVVLL